MRMQDVHICYEPIGIIRTDFTSIENLPKQAAFADDTTGRVELLDEYADGLTDLDGFSHVILLYHLDQIDGAVQLLTEPFPDDVERGLFATRTPRRPNPIGMSVVRLNNINGTTLRFSGVDMLDQTPLLDVKPFIPAIDTRNEYTIGWLERDVKRDPSS